MGSAVWSIGCLVAGIVVMFVRPRQGAVWFGPAAVAVVAVATGAVDTVAAGDALEVMRDPLLFLVFAVPLAIALDRIGVFEALAALVDGGRHLGLALWVLAAAVTVVFNLDAAVVLLTPLYIRIARLNALPVEALAFQPALLACLASHPLPVSNLTNLIVAERFDLTVADFVTRLGPVTLLAVVVGWLAYRRVFPLPMAQPALDVEADRGALRRGLPVVGLVLVGFTAGDAIGVPAWAVAAVALALACVAAGSVPSWRSVPFEAIGVAAGLSVLVAGAVPHLGLGGVLDGTGTAGRLQALLFGAVGSNVTNNLPAVLAGSAEVRPDQVWPLLVGVNVAPAVVMTGALSSLLWRDTAARLGVEVSARRFSSVGIRVGLPALVAAGAFVVLAG